MKKIFKTMLALMAGAMVFTACSSDDDLENISGQKTSALKPMTFYASMEGQDGGMRTVIDADGVSINWSTTDKISIFDGASENDGNQMFTLETGEGTTSATFTGSAASASTYYALYPYMASFSEVRVPTKKEAMAAGGVDEWYLEDWKEKIESDENGVIEEMGELGISNENQAFILDYLKNQTRTFKSGVQRNGNQFKDVVFPAEQTVTEGQFVDPKAMLMIAESDDYNSLKFKNVCAYVKVKPEFDCKAIRLISKGTENLAGTVTLDYNGGTPTANVTANGVSMVSLTGTITAGNTYYIAVLPATLNSGFTISFATTDVIYKKSTTKALTLTRSNVVNLGSFATSSLISVSKTGTAEATIGGETVNVPWVQLWENGPKWAVYNVGVTDGKEESFGGTYAWNENATTSWGSKWRMPSENEFAKEEEDEYYRSHICGGLLYECTCTWVSNYNETGVNGLLCAGKGDFASQSIFLPATDGDYGAYLSSTHGVNQNVSFLYIDNTGGYKSDITEGTLINLRAVLAE